MEGHPVTPCEASAGYGDHVCCLPAGHDDWHESRKWRSPDGSLWARWSDSIGDSEPYECNHEEMEHVTAAEDHDVLRCTRCGGVFAQWDDDDGPITLTHWEGRKMQNKRIRYDPLDCEVPGCWREATEARPQRSGDIVYVCGQSHVTGTPNETDIALDEDGHASEGTHDDIAYEAGYLTEDEYEAAGMPSWWLES